MKHLVAVLLIAALALPAWAEEPEPASLTRAERLVQAGVREILSRMLEVDVELDRVSAGEDGRLIELHGLRVGNPKGFSEPHVFTAETVRIQADLRSLFSREPTIELIEVEGAGVVAENTVTAGSNLMLLMRRARAATPSGPLARLRPQKQWRIDHAALGESTVDVVNQLLGRRQHSTSTLGPATFSFGTEDERVSGEQIVAEFLGWMVEELSLLPDRSGAGGRLSELLPKVL